MTADELQKHIASEQARAKSLEQEAIAHEVAAREKRAQRAEIKDSLSELGASLVQLRNQEAARRAMEAAVQAKDHAESHATSLAAEVKKASALNEELQKLIDQQKELMADKESKPEPN